MSFNINQFQAQVSRRGLAKNNLFLTRISLPNSLNYLEENISTRELTFLCKSAAIPGMNINFSEYQPSGFGLHEKRPTDIRYGDLSLIFMVDSQFATMKFFKKWMQSIINYNTYDGYLQTDRQGKLPYHFAYKEEYAATVEILVYSGHDASSAYHYKFGNAFPIGIGSLDQSWENQGDIMTLPVGFAFDKFKTDSVELGQVRQPNLSGNGPLSYISAANGFAQAIRAIDRPTSIQDAINQITNVTTVFNAL
jgi:hypothetical protein